MISPRKEYRKDGDVIYVPQINVTIVIEQIRHRFPGMSDAIDNGQMTMTTQDPTKTQAAALKTTISKMLSAEDAILLLRQLQRMFDDSRVYLNVGTGEIYLETETQTPSALMSQTAYNVAELPE